MFKSLASVFTGGGYDYLKGSISNYFAEKRARDQAALEYAYAKRYAENSPTWTVSGLRAAGLNPILAASGGFSASSWHPSSPSTPNTDSRVGIDAIDNMLTSRQNRETSKSQAGLNESQSGLNEANEELAKANTAVKLLEAQQIKNELKGKGYKNDVVNDVMRGMSDTAEFLKTDAAQNLKSSASNSPTSKDTRGNYINVGPDSRRDSTSSSHDSTPSYDDEKMEKLYEKHLKTLRRKRFEAYEDSFDRMPRVRRFIYR